MAASGARIEGRTLLADMPRLGEDSDGGSAVVWSAVASQTVRPAGEALVHLRLRAHVDVTRACQRCLEPIKMPLDLDRRLRWVHGEAVAERLDADSDEDVLALVPAVDLVELIEDELLLALPVVPRHDQCIDLAALGGGSAGNDADLGDAPNPFQVLASLKRR